MDRQGIFQYVESKYNTKPEYLWKKYPSYAVFRHSYNRKWYGIIMSVNKENTGLKGEQIGDILDLKLRPETVEFFQSEKGFLPAYHMNKSNWISVIIGKVDRKQICNLIDASFELTKK